MYVLTIKQNYESVSFEFEALDDATKVLQLLEGNEEKDTDYTINKSVKAEGEKQNEK